ncbi:MAG: hypothetical protein ACRDV0_00615 [Acidimicrobiales bacterium]
MGDDVRGEDVDLPIGFDLNTLRRELLGTLAVVEKLENDLQGAIASLPDDPEGVAEVVMSRFREIEAVSNYAGRLFAIFAHRQLGVSLARLSHNITPSAMRRRIMIDEREGLERPERFEFDRDADAAGPGLTHYEILCRESALHPWPARVPLPSRRERQRRKNPDYHPEAREIYRADSYRELLESHPEIRTEHPFGRPGTPEPSVPDPRDDPAQNTVVRLAPRQR